MTAIRGRPWSRMLRLCVAVALFVSARVDCASADTNASVVLVAAEVPTAKLDAQLVAELTVAGLSVRAVPWKRLSEGLNGLAIAGPHDSARALLRIKRSPAVVEVWIADRESGLFHQRESVPRARDDADARWVSVRTSELVRAALLPSAVVAPSALSAAPPAQQVPASAAIVPPTPVQESAVAATPEVSPELATQPAGVPPFYPKFGASLGVALDRPATPFGPTVHGELDVQWYIRSRWTLASAVLLPGFAKVHHTYGRAALRAGLVDLEVRREFADQAARLRPRIGVAAGLGWAHLRTRSNTPVLIEQTRRFEACILGLLGASLRLVSRLSLAFDLRAGAALPSHAVRIGSQKIGASEIPLVIGSLTLELSFG